MTTALSSIAWRCLFQLPAINLSKPAGFFGFTIILLFCCPDKINAQDKDYLVEANIIYRFTKYIDWPSDKKEGDFIIGVTGDSPLYYELKKTLANKTTGNQKIVVKKIAAISASYNCHILFISEEDADNIKKIVAKTVNMPILLVSESEGLAEKGSCINFNIIADHLKLEINKTTITQRNLSIASELVRLGKIVK